MLPYFNASGHFLYAKSGHLYLQEMYDVENRMDIFEYEKFTNEGYFTVRRTEKYRSGIWSDMTIEQTLMRPRKTSGGLTQGRGMSESVLCKWILSMIVFIEVSDAMENFCQVSYVTSEQHIETRKSRISRDAADLRKLHEFFDSHYPFPATNNIISITIYTLSVGNSIMKQMVGENFSSVKFKRKNKILPLKAVSASIKINSEIEIIDPTLIFQRLSLNIQDKSKNLN